MLRKQPTDLNLTEPELPEDLPAWVREDRLVLFALEAVWEQHLDDTSVHPDSVGSVRVGRSSTRS